jgi:regulator of sigma E protease
MTSSGGRAGDSCYTRPDMQYVLPILALGVLVVVHEAGHFLVARWSRMRVERFSIGFGPPLLKWRSGETQFQLAPVPFGGFVQITGMNPHEEFDEKDPYVYPNRPAILRFLAILAGPAMNYVLAVVVIFGYYLAAGVDQEVARWKINKVEPDAPAAGLFQPGDRLLKVNGVDVWASMRDDLPDFRAEVQKAGGAPIHVTVERAGKPVEIQVTPKLAPPPKEAKGGEPPQYIIGVGIDAERKPVGVGEAAGYAAAFPVEKTQQILGQLLKVIKGKEEPNFAGPVEIVHVMKIQFQHGWDYALQLVATLSLMLGLFNLLPIPGLDGGRLAFLGYELATRRRPNPKVEATVHMFGILILFLVLIVVTFNDIKALFT